MKSIILLLVSTSNLILLAQSDQIAVPIDNSIYSQYSQLVIEESHSSLLNTENIAYGFEIPAYTTVSVPIPDGFPKFYYEPWGGVATSMCIGGDGNFYLTTEFNAVYKFHPLTKTIDPLRTFYISGLITGDIVMGITYNPVNEKYYIAASSYTTHSDNIYELNINTGHATLIGPTNTGGMQADLTITCDGICYSYDLITNNSYKIDLTSGSATLLGSLGFNPHWGQGMDVDRENGVVYLSSFDSTTFSGQLRVLNTETGGTTVVWNWGPAVQIMAFAISTKCSDECLLQPPDNPLPQSGAFGISTTLDSLSFDVDAAATNVKIYFGEIWDMRLVYDGPVITSFTIPPLDSDLVYTWRVVAKNEICERYSPVWLFGTIEDPTIDTLFADDFENGLWNWVITNDGNCTWELYNPPYPNYYNLPQIDSGGILSADADLCGGETTINSKAIIDQSLDLSMLHWAWIEFDYDWKVLRPADKAIIEISTNGGSSWIEVWNKTGNEIRNCREIVDVTLPAAGKSNVNIRFNSIQPGWDWWWVIDNVEIKGIICESCSPLRPTKLIATNLGFGKISLSWADNSSNEAGFNVERKIGDSLSVHEFEIIGITQTNVHNFLDTTILASTTYTYRVNAFNENGSSAYTNWKTILSHVPVELISFSATAVSDKVTLNWSTATELNNHIFEIERQMEEQEFYTIGYVQGNGTTTEVHNYMYTDKNVERGKYFYRLKQIDYQGTYQYSNEIEVHVVGILEFDLGQNYPNPFNPSTVISYQLPVSGMVTLKVFDILGNEVATLVNEENQPGTYEVEFSIHSDESRNLSSGIYFYQLRAGNFVETNKMVLMK